PTLRKDYPDADLIPVINKTDLFPPPNEVRGLNPVLVSAKEKTGLDKLRKHMLKATLRDQNADELIITNARHYEALSKADKCLEQVISGLDSGLSGELLAMDIRQSLFHLS